MLTITDYDLLVLRAFEALKREINEAEQYTVNHYNNLMKPQTETKTPEDFKPVQKETASKNKKEA